MNRPVKIINRSLRLLTIVFWMVLQPAAIRSTGAADTPGSSADSTARPEQGYRIDQPGTITFTVGVKISGKVEKPQVMIFLPKEKTQYRDQVLSRSFIGEISQPLPFSPVTQ